MTKPALVLILAALSAARLSAQDERFELKDGVLTYRDAVGKRSEIRVGGPCADLWVSPEGDMIAFIRIDKSEPDDYGGPNPFIEASTIFVASRSNRFAPVRVAVAPPLVDGREWTALLDPVLSPDHATVYFLIPAAGTSWCLLSVPITGGTARAVGYVEVYCVLWGGADSGAVLAMTRYQRESAEGLDHRFERYDAAGREEVLSSGHFLGQFEGLVRDWLAKHGGTCQSN